MDSILRERQSGRPATINDRKENGEMYLHIEHVQAFNKSSELRRTHPTSMTE